MESFPRWQLQLERRDARGSAEELVFRRDRLEVGRTAGQADIVLDSGNISRRHCSIWVDGSGQVLVQDQNSTNGTYLNGRRLVARRQHLLKVGDRLRLGDWQLALKEPAESVASAMARSARLEALLDRAAPERSR